VPVREAPRNKSGDPAGYRVVSRTRRGDEAPAQPAERSFRKTLCKHEKWLHFRFDGILLSMKRLPFSLRFDLLDFFQNLVEHRDALFGLLYGSLVVALFNGLRYSSIYR